MRFSHFACIVAMTLIGSMPARSQNYPAEMPITAAEVEARSGPSMEFYATSRLVRGDRVKILRASKQPGWLEIAPPAGSFSWISDRFMQPLPGNKMGYVFSETAAPVLAGSERANTPTVIAGKVPHGSTVVIVGPPRSDVSGVWYPIAPHPTEVRYIPSEAVKSTQLAAANPQSVRGATVPTATPQPGHPGNAERPTPTYNGNGSWQPVGNANSNNTNPTNATLTSYNKPAASQPAAAVPATTNQWSVYGVLRKTAIKKDGQSMYVLENRYGQPILYVTAQPGFHLNPYVGHTVSLFGPISYRIDEYMRMYYMTALYVNPAN
jgi:hypothetical protein